MKNYLLQLLQDIEDTILNQWRVRPPHFYEMGLPEKWLTPPKGYQGPPFGFGHEEDSERNKGYLAQLEFEKTQAEIEKYISGEAPANMFGYFGFEPNQFPPVEKIEDEQLKMLCDAICRLWASFNYTASFPEKTPERILYPILVNAMHEPRMYAKRGHIGVEFCDYEPENCPFGAASCSCKYY